MGSLDDLARTVANLNSTPTKIFVPQVGHRVVTKTSEGRILDTGGKDFTGSFSTRSETPKKEFVEDNQRKDVSELAENESISPVQTVNLGLFRTANTLKSFKELKQMLLNDINTDPDTIQNLENIEQYLSQIQKNYFEQKEELRNQFK